MRTEKYYTEEQLKQAFIDGSTNLYNVSTPEFWERYLSKFLSNVREKEPITEAEWLETFDRYKEETKASAYATHRLALWLSKQSVYFSSQEAEQNISDKIEALTWKHSLNELTEAFESKGFKLSPITLEAVREAEHKVSENRTVELLTGCKKTLYSCIALPMGPAFRTFVESLYNDVKIHLESLPSQTDKKWTDEDLRIAVATVNNCEGMDFNKVVELLTGQTDKIDMSEKKGGK